jgi:hypothetical protein
MPSSDDADAQYLARFREITAGLEPDQLHALLGDLMSAACHHARRPSRPEHRRTLPPSTQVLTVRVDLQHATPPIWRRLELRSDLTFEEVHDVLQTAFGWAGYHLWRFSVGGGPFDRNSQLFLCEFDVDEGEDEGVPAGEVRLGELLQEPGDLLEYVYDYGDDWDLRIVVESVREAEADAAPARATGGRRAAPPEDCGGLRDAEDLAAVLEDPARFDLAALDRALRTDAQLPELLAEPLQRLGRSPVGRALRERATLLRPLSDPLADEGWDDALRAVTWFLEQADAEGGIPLTSAGYLHPSTVEAASEIVPRMADWIGKNNREAQSPPLLSFREALQQLKILRKYKGALLPTRRARAMLQASQVRELVLDSLVPAPGGFDRPATALLLLHVATTTPGMRLATEEIAQALTQLGWHVGQGPVPVSTILELPAWQLLANIGTLSGRRAERHMAFSPEASQLAREALC